jgi:uncharacterized repeat protein (TIGR01451 family)
VATADSDQTPEDTDTETIPVPSPSLNTDKVFDSNADEDGSGTVSLDDTLTYIITVTNTGNANLTNVTVTDSLITPTGGTTPCALVAPGGICTLVGTYVVTQGDVDAGEVENTGTGDSDQTPPDDDIETVPVPQDPDIEIVKSADQVIEPGDTATFTIKVTNTGNVTLTSVTVDDPLASDCDDNLGSMAPGDVETYTCTESNVQSGFVNEATVTGTPPDGPDVDDSDTAEVELAEITITKTVLSDLPLIQGDLVQFEITVVNTGEVRLRSTRVIDRAEAACARSASQVRSMLNSKGFPVGTWLGVGESFTYECADEVAETFTNVAKARGRSQSGLWVQDTDDATVTVVDPAIRIEKTATPLGGGVVEFHIRVENIGDQALKLTEIDDPLADVCSRSRSEVRALLNQKGNKVGATLGVGESFEYDCFVEISEGFTNTVTVMAFWEGLEIMDNDQVVVELEP